MERGHSEPRFNHEKIAKKHERINALSAYYKQRAKFNAGAEIDSKARHFSEINVLGANLDRLGITPMTPEEWSNVKEAIAKVLTGINAVERDLLESEKDAVTLGEQILGSNYVAELISNVNILSSEYNGKIPDQDALDRVSESSVVLKESLSIIKETLDAIEQQQSLEVGSDPSRIQRKETRIASLSQQIINEIYLIKNGLKRAMSNLESIKHDIAA